MGGYAGREAGTATVAGDDTVDPVISDVERELWLREGSISGVMLDEDA